VSRARRVCVRKSCEGGATTPEMQEASARHAIRGTSPSVSICLLVLGRDALRLRSTAGARAWLHAD
jgi:hypothetical protein